MNIEAFRIVHERHVDSAFSGEGARLYGGRWNSKGTRVVYVAQSASLATLELLVHTKHLALLESRFALIKVEFDRSLVAEPPQLPPGWNDPQVTIEGQLLGDTWVKQARSAVLKVPSVVTPGEFNYLLNPAHPFFSRIKIGEPVSFRPDARLWRAL